MKCPKCGRGMNHTERYGTDGYLRGTEHCIFCGYKGTIKNLDDGIPFKYLVESTPKEGIKSR